VFLPLWAQGTSPVIQIQSHFYCSSPHYYYSDKSLITTTTLLFPNQQPLKAHLPLPTMQTAAAAHHSNTPSRKRSLSLATGKLSLSSAQTLRPKSSGYELTIREEEVDDEHQSSRLGFCSLPIRRTGEGVRRLIRRASQSFKFHPSSNSAGSNNNNNDNSGSNSSNNSNKSLIFNRDSEKKPDLNEFSPTSSLKSKSKVSFVNADSESGFFQTGDDCFYASDTLAVRRGTQLT